MRLRLQWVCLAMLVVSSSAVAQSPSGKMRQASSQRKISYQEAKKRCLDQDPGLSKEELRYCIKKHRKKGVR